MQKMKYLGVIFDDKLSWRPHVEHVSTKLSNGSWALLKLRNYVDLNSIVVYSILTCNTAFQLEEWRQEMPWKL